MLTAIRERVTGLLAFFIVGLLVISFAFWGVGSYIDGNNRLLVATVNNYKITVQEFQRAFLNTRQQLQELIDRPLNEQEVELIKANTLQQLINTRLLTDLSEQLMLEVAEVDINSAIKELPAFKDAQGKFSITRYEQALSNLNMDSAILKQTLLSELRSEQIQSTLAESVFIPNEEIIMLKELKNERRNISYVILSTSDIKESISVDEEEIDAFYQADDQHFISLEKLKIAYIELDSKKISDDLVIDDAELLAYFEANRDNYLLEEKRSFSQLIVHLKDTMSEEKQQMSKVVVEELYEIAKGGRSLFDIVNDEDLINQKNIDVDFLEHQLVSKEIMEPEIDSFLFSGKLDDISAPIQSKTGYSIIKINDIESSQLVFTDVQEQVEQDYRTYKSEDIFFDKAEQLVLSSYENPDTLEVSAELLDIPITESDYFTRQGGFGLVSKEEIIAVSFSDPVRLERNNSDLVELSDNRVVVLRVIDDIPQTKRPLEEIREEVVAKLQEDKAKEAVFEEGERIFSQLQSDINLDAFMDNEQIEWKDTKNTRRDDENINRAILREAFSLGKPAGNEPLYGYTILGQGDYVVIQVTPSDNDTAYEDDDIEVDTEKDIKALVLKARSAQEWRDFTDALRARSDINIYSENL